MRGGHGANQKSILPEVSQDLRFLYQGGSVYLFVHVNMLVGFKNAKL